MNTIKVKATSDLSPRQHQSDILENLSPSERASYYIWLSGIDLRGVLPAKSLARDRKAILRIADVDIATARNLA